MSWLDSLREKKKRKGGYAKAIRNMTIILVVIGLIMGWAIKEGIEFRRNNTELHRQVAEIKEWIKNMTLIEMIWIVLYRDIRILIERMCDG